MGAASRRSRNLQLDPPKGQRRLVRRGALVLQKAANHSVLLSISCVLSIRSQGRPRLAPRPAARMFSATCLLSAHGKSGRMSCSAKPVAAVGLSSPGRKRAPPVPIGICCASIQSDRKQSRVRRVGDRSLTAAAEQKGGACKRSTVQARSDLMSSLAVHHVGRRALSVRGASPSPAIEGPKARHWTHCSGIAIPCPAWMPNYESGAGSMWRLTKAQVRSDLRSAIMGRHIVKPESHALMANPSSATKMPGTRRERRLRPMQNPSPA